VIKKQIIYLIFLFLGLFCFSCKQEQKSEIKVVRKEKVELISNDKIRFDFLAAHINTSKETIEINASLYNDYSDTAYFLSSSCDGEQYSLSYDTTKFSLFPYLLCNISYPIIIKIAPKGHHDFKAHFTCSRTEKKIKLGFDFYSVNSSFDLQKQKDLKIFYRPKDKQTIIWAEEKIIK
jgi:hypothetical protein